MRGGGRGEGEGVVPSQFLYQRGFQGARLSIPPGVVR